MKKLLFFSICLLMININCDACVVMNNAPTSSLIYQSEDWEKLGSISAISEYGIKETFILFVKVIGRNSYYQVRKYYSGNSYSHYAVARGRFVFKGKKYNAKFTQWETTYYFNL